MRVAFDLEFTFYYTDKSHEKSVMRHAVDRDPQQIDKSKGLPSPSMAMPTDERWVILDLKVTVCCTWMSRMF